MDIFLLDKLIYSFIAGLTGEQFFKISLSFLISSFWFTKSKKVSKK